MTDVQRLRVALVQELRDELHELMASQEYAYAMGHGCSMGDHPRFVEIRRRVSELRALIEEHEEP